MFLGSRHRLGLAASRRARIHAVRCWPLAEVLAAWSVAGEYWRSRRRWCRVPLVTGPGVNVVGLGLTTPDLVTVTAG